MLASDSLNGGGERATSRIALPIVVVRPCANREIEHGMDAMKSIRIGLPNCIAAVRGVSARARGIVELYIYMAIFWKRRLREDPRVKRHILIAPPGGGNIGDQAMVESFLSNVRGDVVVITKGQADFPDSLQSGSQVEWRVMPNLIYGSGFSHWGEVARFCDLLSQARSVSVVGADIMDGAYNAGASVRRSNLALLSARQGIDSRILGFSWNGAAKRSAVEALKRASVAGVKLFLRDPVSFRRARRDGLINLVEAADTVFSLPRSPSLGPSPNLDGRHLPRALVNMSALIERSHDQIPEYEKIVRHLLSSGYEVLLLPHVSRLNGDDLGLLAVLHSRIADDRVDLVGGLPTPAEVRQLCASASVVVTGRMHLGVLALTEGVVPIILSTQGKVDGLMALFELTEFVVEPDKGIGSEVIDRIEALRGDAGLYAQLVARNMSEVRSKSALNFVIA